MGVHSWRNRTAGSKDFKICCRIETKVLQSVDHTSAANQLPTLCIYTYHHSIHLLIIWREGNSQSFSWHDYRQVALFRRQLGCKMINIVSSARVLVTEHASDLYVNLPRVWLLKEEEDEEEEEEEEEEKKKKKKKKRRRRNLADQECLYCLAVLSLHFFSMPDKNTHSEANQSPWQTRSSWKITFRQPWLIKNIFLAMKALSVNLHHKLL